jgi:hypothetical protein
MAIPRLYKGFAMSSLTSQRPFPLLFVATIDKKYMHHSLEWNGAITTATWGQQMLCTNICLTPATKYIGGEIFYAAHNS